MNAIDIGLLGPLEVAVGGTNVPLRGSRQREVVALLALHVNEVVPRDTLIDELWEDDPPETAAKIVQNAVSQLRKALGAAGLATAIETEFDGYVLHVDPETIDARRFERLAAEGRAALASADAVTAHRRLREGLVLWRGRALADVAGVPFAQAEAARLEELRLATIEDRIEAELALGLHAEVAAELEALVAQHPLRERLRAHLMLALYRLGRQADALTVYQDTRRALVDKLGIEPSPFLRRLERAILRQEPELEAPRAEAPRVAVRVPAARAARKTVAVLSAEVAPASAPTDPEALARLTERALEVAERVVGAHGATVERLPGGSVLAVYGVPAVREDDALRAARAALELSEELGGNGRDPKMRIGIASGEVLVDPSGHVSGQPVVAAVHLQQRAAPGDVLICAATERLLRAAGSLERVEAAGDEPAWRLLDLAPDTPAVPRTLDTPLIGRVRELEQLQQALERATSGRTAQLATVLGPAGIGKSRLAAEFVGSVGGEASVVTGRCASYGQGLTFRPLAEMLGPQLADPEGLPRLLADEPGASLFLSQTAGAIGLTEVSSTPTETFWAVRRLLEALARRQPLVVVIDDIHWAEPLFLDLVEHIAERTRSAPILLLCLARPDLLDDHPGWGGDRANATTILLEPLSHAETAALIDELPGGAGLEAELRTRLAAAAEGNPLFLEQTLALLREEPPAGERLPVPATIQALLAARLDRLPPRERLVLEYAAVIGRDFEVDPLRSLLPDLDPDGDVARDLSELARKDLIRPARLADDADAFRFAHSLIRTAAYESMPKEERARLHEAFVGWLDEREAASEVAGYHLEQAYQYLAELAPEAEATMAVGQRAGAALADAGRRASARGDVSAAVALFSRAADVTDPAAPARLELLADLAEALRESGAFARAQEVAAEVADEAAAAGDRRLAAQATIVGLRSQLQTDPNVDTDAVRAEAERAVAVFETARDDARLAKTWELLAQAPWRHGQVGAAETALRRAIHHARRADDRRTEAQALNFLVGAALHGPTPVKQGIELCAGILDSEHEQLRTRAAALGALGAFRAMEGDFDEGRRLLAEQRAILEDLGLVLAAAATAERLAFVELLAGDPAAAEREVRRGYETLERLGETTSLSTLAAVVAHALVAQERHDEALSFSELSARASASDDVVSQVLLRTAQAKALAATGHGGDAEVIAREAVIRAERTDFVLLHAEALGDLAEVLRKRGAAAAAREPLERALRLYTDKGNVVAAKRVRALLEAA